MRAWLTNSLAHLLPVCAVPVILYGVVCSSCEQPCNLRPLCEKQHPNHGSIFAMCSKFPTQYKQEGRESLTRVDDRLKGGLTISELEPCLHDRFVLMFGDKIFVQVWVKLIPPALTNLNVHCVSTILCVPSCSDQAPGRNVTTRAWRGRSPFTFCSEMLRRLSRGQPREGRSHN